MLQLKTLGIYCGLLVLLLAQCEAKNSTLNETVTDCPPESDDDRTPIHDLCDDFQLIRDLIDLDVLMDLIQSHYQCNAKFRKAVCYYKTNRFDLVIEQLQLSESWQALLEELRFQGVNITAIENISDIFACIEVPAVTLGPSDKKCNCKELRGHTFIGDVLAAIPHQQVQQYSYNSSVANTNFARFRKVVTSPDFQAKLRSNLMKRDAVRGLRVLARNGWDLPELLRGAMSILSW